MTVLIRLLSKEIEIDTLVGTVKNPHLPLVKKTGP